MNFVKDLYEVKFDVDTVLVLFALEDSHANDVVCCIAINTVNEETTKTIKATQIPKASAISAKRSW